MTITRLGWRACGKVEVALVGSVVEQLLDRISRVLCAQRGETRSRIAEAHWSVTARARGDVSGAVATPIERLAHLVVGRVRLEPRWCLTGVISREIRNVFIGESHGERIHDRVVAVPRTEELQLLFDVPGVLSGEVGPFWVNAVAIDAVASGADGGFGCARFGVALREGEWCQAKTQGENGEGGGKGLGDRHFSRLRASGGGAKVYTKPPFSCLRGCAGVSRFPKAHFLLSAAAPAQFPAEPGVEVAFAGRSNAGKSSAINAIAERKALARTSKTPGQTRLLNYFELEPGHRIVDLPGYGYAEVRPDERRKWGPLIDALRRRELLRGLLLVVDARRGLRDEDFALIDWADPARRAVHVLLSKADKLTQTERASALRDARAALSELATVQLFSAHSGLGVREAQDRLVSLWTLQLDRTSEGE